MTVYDDTITFNNVSLNVESISPTKKQKTRKIIIGKTLTQVNIIGLGDTQWVLDVTGIITGTTLSNLSTNRAAVEGLDSVTAYDYVDGMHNGTYIVVPGSLSFTDKATDGNLAYRYNFTLIEE